MPSRQQVPFRQPVKLPLQVKSRQQAQLLQQVKFRQQAQLLQQVLLLPQVQLPQQARLPQPVQLLPQVQLPPHLQQVFSTKPLINSLLLMATHLNVYLILTFLFFTEVCVTPNFVSTVDDTIPSGFTITDNFQEDSPAEGPSPNAEDQNNPNVPAFDQDNNQPGVDVPQNPTAPGTPYTITITTRPTGDDTPMSITLPDLVNVDSIRVTDQDGNPIGPDVSGQLLC